MSARSLATLAAFETGPSRLRRILDVVGDCSNAEIVDEWFVRTDGGRADAGFRGADAGDCVTRAIAVATGRPYRRVYDDLAALSAEAGGRRSARDGVAPKVYRRYLDALGWVWTPTMTIGSGCSVHLHHEELPPGRLVVRLSRHLAAVVDGVLYDNHDSRRDGSRCVYGYWTAP